MELCLEHLMHQERELSINVNTLAQTEQLLKRLNDLEANAQVSISPVTMLKSDFQFLIPCI